jgi:hypothetical protein
MLSMPPYSDYPAYLAHPVFRAARTVAMRRAGGRCRCGARATEVHHPNRHYPAWGMFDVAADLQPICHRSATIAMKPNMRGS